MKKGKIKALCFTAEWDSNVRDKQDNMCQAAREAGMSFELIEVEDNVPLTIKYGVRNVPTIVLIKDGKVIGVERGNNGYKHLANYSRKTN